MGIENETAYTPMLVFSETNQAHHGDIGNVAVVWIMRRTESCVEDISVVVEMRMRYLRLASSCNEFIIFPELKDRTYLR